MSVLLPKTLLGEDDNGSNLFHPRLFSSEPDPKPFTFPCFVATRMPKFLLPSIKNKK
jgi:hypothetical protein